MIKLLLLLDDPIYWAVIIGQFVYILKLRKRMRGIDNPELWLTRKERHKRALEKLEAADDEKRQARLQKDLETIQGFNPTKENQ